MLRLVLSRFAARGTVHAALLLVVALAAGLLAGGDRGFQTALDGGVRALVLDAPGAAGVRLQTALADDARAQDDAARKLLEQRFAGAATTVTRSVSATVIADSGRRVVVLADAGVADAARLESGSWPAAAAPGTGPVDAAVQADAAAALGLAVGDELPLSETVRLRVVGTWRPADPAAARWLGEPAPLSGADGAAVGPFVVDETSMPRITGTASVRWVVAPVADSVDERTARRLATAASPGDLVTAAERAGGIAAGAVTADGGLADAAARALAAARAGRAAVSAPLVAAGVVALVTVLLLAGLLTGVRLDESRTLRARGASLPQRTAWSVAEALMVALPGATVGWAAAGADPARRGTAALVGAAAAILVAGRGVLAAAALEGSAERSGPASTARAALGVALGLGALLAVWQLQLHGPVGALASAAPALALLAAVLALTAAARPTWRLLARGTGRWRGALAAVGAAQVARGAATLAVAAVISALGLGAVGLSAVTVDSTQAADRAAAQRAAVTDVRVELATPDVVDAVVAPLTAASVGAVAGVDDALLAVSTTVQVGREAVRLVAAPMDGLGRVVRDAGAVPAGAARLAAVSGAEPLDGELRVDVAVAGAGPDRTGQVTVVAWLADPQGAPVRVTLDPVDVARPATATGRLPGGGPWSLLALDATLAGSPGPDLDVTMTTPGGRELAAVTLSSLRARGRAPVATVPAALPVMVTPELAAGRDLRPGADLTLALPRGGSVPAVVAGVVDRVPAATGRAALADLGTFVVAALAAEGPVPAPDELWLATPQPAAVAVAVRSALPYAARVTTVASASTAPVLAPVADAASRGAAGAALLSVVGLTTAAVAVARARRDEDGVLRALGMRGRSVAALRAAQLAVAVAGGLVAGLAGAFVAGWSCVGPLVAAAVPGAIAAPLAVGPPGAVAVAWAAGALLVVLALGVAGLRPTGVRGVR